MKFNLGKRQTKMFYLLGISITLHYYANKLLATGVNFSDGFLVGFLFGLGFVCSVTILYLFIEMIVLNFKVRIKSKK